MNYCSSCTNWNYNERIEQKYGMGSGICKFDNEVKGCDRKACLLYEKRSNDSVYIIYLYYMWMFSFWTIRKYINI